GASEATNTGSQELLTCLVCLDILKEPVTTPCGHNYCMECITGCWEQAGAYSCPQCRETFTPRPVLCRNTLLAEVVQKLNKRGSNSALPQNYAGPGEVECSFCAGRKFRAVKSCLTCLASFCETHIQLHYEGAAWKSHRLVSPTGNLQQKLCTQHQRGLEAFCKTDQMCICLLCVANGHRSHETVELEAERAEKQVRHLRYFRCLRWAKWYVIMCREFPLYFCPSFYIPMMHVVMMHMLMGQLIVFFLCSDACHLTLDPNTAHTRISLSEGNKKATWMEEAQSFIDHPDRFDCKLQVLCAEGLSGTRCYWEVEWRGGAWIGVTYKGISRKGRDLACLLGWNDKSWSLFCSSSSYIAWHNNNKTKISAPCFSRIGVYLDYPTGCLSFFCVTDTMMLLHRFMASFTEPLYPGFGLHPYLDSSITISCTLIKLMCNIS
uniref:Tripartite motif-containing protein 16-like n=1 Tax=Erpetoichthys calabaricus TaxID=27687 RepID=A0A8C4RDT6_ERPCA